MNGKRILSIATAGFLLLPTLAFASGCGEEKPIRLRVYSWEEYIDEGGEDSYVYDEIDGMIHDDYKAWNLQTFGSEVDESAPSLLNDFERWYEHKYGTPITVEYSTFGTNEDMYNQLKLGDTYDLICPSEYMIMKLAAENMLVPYPESFFDQENEDNHYARNVSPFIDNVFTSHTVTVTDESGNQTDHLWRDYAAGYMWGTTGMIYNPETADEDDLINWNVMLNKSYQNEVTTKDNVRDSYFVGLAILYEEELLSLRSLHESGNLSDEEYTNKIAEIMNRTDEQSVQGVQEILLSMKDNLYGFETDTGKSDLVKGIISLNFAWSGDAVYAIDLAEEEDVILKYFVPQECANLWFDGWVMPKDENRTEETVQAAHAFVNFLSMPYNAIRNMYYIGYTSAIASDEVLEYIDYMYGIEEGDEGVPYDLSYFFGYDAEIVTYEDQLSRQLFAQYPPEDVMLRCSVMDYFDTETYERINELWAQVKGAELDAWAIAVICVSIVAITAFFLLIKFGNKIDFFRTKPKKGYVKVKQEPYRKDVL
ncbi:MAG: extracellular solute-binding protein [Clostridia bacterium]|nr:extracellular solute-binding protein [Clostridia bacterium]